MPFFLVHGAEAVLLVKIIHEAPRISNCDETSSNEALQDDVDALMKQEMLRWLDLCSINKIFEIITVIRCYLDLLW
jgi:hypothetical protein